MSDQPLPPRKKLVTGLPVGTEPQRPQLLSGATPAAAQHSFLTPELQARLAEAKQQQIPAEQQAAWDAEQQRLAAEQQAAWDAEQQRLAAEQQAAWDAEQQRLAAEQQAAWDAEQQRLAEAQAAEEAQQQATQATTQQVQEALAQLQAAQQALQAAQAQAELLQSQQQATAAVPQPQATTPMAPAATSATVSPRFATGPAAQPTAGRSVFKTPAPTLHAAGAPAQPSPSSKPALGSAPVPTLRPSSLATGGRAPSPKPGTGGNFATPNPSLSQSEGGATVLDTAAAKKKKTIRNLTIAVCAAAVVCGGAMFYISNRDAKIRAENQHYKELQELGVALGRESAALGENKGGDVLKYDPQTFKTQVKANQEDAEFLMKRIRSTQDPTGALAAIHLVAVMGQLDPAIALTAINDMTNNTGKYTKKQISMFTTILASAKNPKIMQHLWLLQSKLAAANQKDLEATVLREMRLGLDPNEATRVMKILLDPDEKKTDSRIVEALAVTLPSMADKADQQGKQIIAEEIVKTLKGQSGEIPAKKLNAALRALAYTGTPTALDYFKELAVNAPLIVKMTAIRNLKYFTTDAAIPVLRELQAWDNEDLKKEPVQRELRNSIFSILGNRLGERNDDEGRKLFQPELDRANKLADEAAKDPNNAKLAQEAQDAKLAILSCIGIAKSEYPYVKEILDQYTKDTNAEIAKKAKDVRELIKTRKDRLKERKGMSEQEKAEYWKKRLEGTAS